jgi:hypothetical protein
MSRNTILNTTSSQFQIITHDGYIENDKERIKKKLNLKSSSINGSEKNSEMMILNYEYQSISTINRKHQNLEKRNERRDNELESSSETLRNPQIKKEINIESPNKTYLNENQFSESDEFNNNIDYNVEESQITNISKIMQLNNSSSQLYKTKQVQINYNDNSQEKSDVSALGLLDDEHSIIFDHQDSIPKFKFINQVIQSNFGYQNIPFEKILKLNSKIIFIIFSFLYDDYGKIMSAGKKIKNLILSTITSKFSYLIQDFQNNYKDIFQFDSFKFKINKYIKQRRKNVSTFYVELKSKIKKNSLLKKYNGISYEIKYSFKMKKGNQKSNLYYQIYKFDIRNDKFYPIWFCSDMDDNNYIKRRIVYSSPVQYFCEGDYIYFKINLIEGNNGIISDITFLPLKNDSAPRKLFLRGIFRSDIEFDKIRDCEIENMVLRWNDENNLIKNSEMYFYVNKCFSKYFEIKEIKYDISKIIFYRIKMLASKIGNVKINRVFNLNIEILPENSETSNECINIGCVNTYTRNKKIQIRKGTLLILYITDVRN